MVFSIPPEILKALGLEEKDSIQIYIDDNRMIVEKIKQGSP